MSRVSVKSSVWRHSQIPDLLALHGDSVDNIPGVLGVGQKTARQILSVCKNVEDLATIDFRIRISFRGRDEILRRIRDNMEAVRISRQARDDLLRSTDGSFTGNLALSAGRSRRTLDPLCQNSGSPRAGRHPPRPTYVVS